jgi:uncharacterized LabA/DUF88 family protein
MIFGIGQKKPKLHIFIDGSWLLKACKGDLRSKCADAPSIFDLSFDKLQHCLLEYVKIKTDNNTIQVGDLHMVMSVFNMPAKPNFLAGKYTDRFGKEHTVEQWQVTRTINAIVERQNFIQKALDSGFSDGDILRSDLKRWSVNSYINGKLREKQADTKLAALMTKYAITRKNDYLAIISGDADMLPAITIALESTKKVILATTHHDTKNQNSSSLFADVEFSIPPLHLNNIAGDIMQGVHIYRCADCQLFYDAGRVIEEQKEQPRCAACKTKK